MVFNVPGLRLLRADAPVRGHRCSDRCWHVRICARPVLLPEGADQARHHDHGGPGVNPDDKGRAAPILVRVYELKSEGTFESADYFSLNANDKAAIGSDLLVGTNSSCGRATSRPPPQVASRPWRPSASSRATATWRRPIGARCRRSTRS
jgi:hypothetical protein